MTIQHDQIKKYQPEFVFGPDLDAKQAAFDLQRTIDDGTSEKTLKSSIVKKASLSLWSRRESADNQASTFSFAVRKGKEHVLSPRRLGLVVSQREISAKRFGVLPPLNEPSVDLPPRDALNVTSSTTTLHRNK